MKKEEAIKIITDKYPDCVIGKITETPKYFLINILTNSSNFIQKLCNDSLKAVDKNTKKVFTYNPIRHGE